MSPIEPAFNMADTQRVVELAGDLLSRTNLAITTGSFTQEWLAGELELFRAQIAGLDYIPTATEPMWNRLLELQRLRTPEDVAAEADALADGYAAMEDMNRRFAERQRAALAKQEGNDG